jgi:hypothetical protein
VASAGCVIVVAAFEAPAVIAGLYDVAMMGQAVAGPFSEREIGGDDDGRALVEAADEVEQQLAAGLSEWQVAELIDSCRALHESTYVESAFMWSGLPLCPA